MKPELFFFSIYCPSLVYLTSSNAIFCRGCDLPVPHSDCPAEKSNSESLLQSSVTAWRPPSTASSPSRRIYFEKFQLYSLTRFSHREHTFIKMSPLFTTLDGTHNKRASWPALRASIRNPFHQTWKKRVAEWPASLGKSRYDSHSSLHRPS
jgi:hypothetical protein